MSGQFFYLNGNRKEEGVVLDSSLDEETSDTSEHEQESEEDETVLATSLRAEGFKYSSEIKEMTMVVKMIQIWMDKWNLLSKQVEENNLAIEILLEEKEKLKTLEKENAQLQEKMKFLEETLKENKRTIQILKRKEERVEQLEKSIHFLQKENHDLTVKLVECNLIM